MAISINSALSALDVNISDAIREKTKAGLSETRRRYSKFANTSFAPNNLFIVDASFVENNEEGQPLYSAGGNFPFPEIDSEQIPYQNSYKYRPGRNQLQPIEVTFYETEDIRVWKYFENWNLSIYNEDGTYKLPSEYEKQMAVYRYANGEFVGNTTHRKSFGLYYEQVWPMGISPYSPVAEDIGIVQFTITFRANRVRRLSEEDNVHPFFEPSDAQIQKARQLAKSKAMTRTAANAAQTAAGALLSPILAPLNVDNPLAALGGNPTPPGSGTILRFS